MYKKLIFLSAILAFGVVVLGAYVRLSDAGLGCPDWPGCYGKLSPHFASAEIAKAAAAHPGGPVSAPKAWKEMIHRYFASTLGTLIVIIGFLSWKNRQKLQQSPALPTVLIGLVVFQGLLGMWTVTELLKPIIVSSHLLGGMTTLAILAWLAARQLMPANIDPSMAQQVRMLARIGLVVLAVQIALGGWVSTNYAALACSDFPTCQGDWWPPMDFSNGFYLLHDLNKDASGHLISMAALTAIHVSHRIGALVSLIVVGLLGVRLLKLPMLKGIGSLLLGLLLVQISLGIANVYFSLPLPVAVAHNAGAALLLVTMVVINFRLTRRI
jgi:cytochrome c oxidase assembly protein subunit 15